MNPNESLYELSKIAQSLQENELLCSKGLLQDDEIDALYDSLPNQIGEFIKPLNDLSQRIYTKHSQLHKANTRWRKVTQVPIASQRDYDSYIKPWMNCIQEILEVYKDQPELKVALEGDNFKWLNSFPKIKSDIQSIQRKMDNNEVNRATMDDIRLLIENFLQTFLGNTKTLENQFNVKNNSPLKEFLKNKNVDTEKITWIEQVLSSFATYQNTYVKHQKEEAAYSYQDIEFCYLQIGSIIKYLSQL